MKKLLLLVLAFVICLSLVACGENKTDNYSQDESQVEDNNQPYELEDEEYSEDDEDEIFYEESLEDENVNEELSGDEVLSGETIDETVE